MSAPDAGRRGDFLSNVIERASERATVVRPRPTALFEPVATSLHVDAAADEARDGAHDDRQREPLKGEPMAPTDDAARRIAPRVSALFDERGEATIEHPRRRMTLALPRAEVPHAATPEPVAIQRAIAPPLLAQNAAPSPLFVSGLARASAWHEPHAADVRAAATGQDVVSRLRTPEPEQARIARLLPTAHIVVAAAAASSDEQANRQSSSQQPPSAPSVTISIGRVEVRAATTPTPPTASARAKSVRAPMGLDEYLGRRERKR